MYHAVEGQGSRPRTQKISIAAQTMPWHQSPLNEPAIPGQASKHSWHIPRLAASGWPCGGNPGPAKRIPTAFPLSCVASFGNGMYCNPWESSATLVNWAVTPWANSYVTKNHPRPWGIRAILSAVSLETAGHPAKLDPPGVKDRLTPLPLCRPPSTTASSRGTTLGLPKPLSSHDYHFGFSTFPDCPACGATSAPPFLSSRQQGR